MPGSTIQAILNQSYQQGFPNRSLPSHEQQAMTRLIQCRTSILGGHVEVCSEGHFQKVHYNSCRHRFCSLCQSQKMEAWLSSQKERLLDCAHYHVIFTVPHKLNFLWKWNRELVPHLMFKAVSRTLIQMLAAPEFLGGIPGILSTLHTWGQDLKYHPHLHCLVTGGGLNGEGKWKKIKKPKVFIPGVALVRKYRGKLLSYLKKAVREAKIQLPEKYSKQRCLNLLNKLGRMDWHVKVLDPYGHGKGVATYLARYMRGGPMSPSRILDFNSQTVTFRYQDNRLKKTLVVKDFKKKTLPLGLFLKQYLQHVPVPGLKVVRGFGLYANNPSRLNQAREILGQDRYEKSKLNTWQDFFPEDILLKLTTCPVCHRPLQRFLEWRQGCAPPDKIFKKLAA